MYIITVLNVPKNETTIVDCFNNDLDAQNNFLDQISTLSASSTNGTTYESVFITKTKCNIYYKENGWLGNYKRLDKIIVLHEFKDYNIIDA
jgi:hypothetical protein